MLPVALSLFFCSLAAPAVCILVPGCICQPWRAGIIPLAMPHESNLNSYYCLAVGLYVGVCNTLQKAASNSSSSLYLCSSNPAEALACKDKGTFILINEAVGLEPWIRAELCQQNHTVTKMLLLIKTRQCWRSTCTLPSPACHQELFICKLC